MAPLPITDDYYAVLEITPNAKEHEIKASYRRLARARHPDKDVGNSNATAAFQLLQAAYSTLVDTAKRREYDLHYPSIPKKPQARPETKPTPGPKPANTSIPKKPQTTRETKPTPGPKPAEPQTNPTPPSSSADVAADIAEIKRCLKLVHSLEDEISELQVQRAQEEALRKETIRTLNKCEADLKQAKENWIPHSIRSLNFAQIELEETKAYLKREIVVIQARIKGIDERIIQATQRVKEIERVLQAAAERVRVADEERLRAREAEIRRQREKEQEAERARAREEERIKAREAEIRRQKEKEREAEQEKARAREEERLKREAELSRQREKEQEAEQARARARAWEAYIRRQREEVMRMKEEKAKEETRKKEAREKQERGEVLKMFREAFSPLGQEKEKEKRKAEELRKELEMRDLKIQQEILKAARVRRETADDSSPKDAELGGSGISSNRGVDWRMGRDQGRWRGREGTWRGRGGTWRGREDTQRPSAARSSGAKADVCEHNGWWEKEADGQTCEQCHRWVKGATFRCRGCDIRTCPGCRNALRGSVTGNS